MEVHFTSDTEAQLQQFAASEGKHAAQLVEETITRILERRSKFLAGVERGIAAADRGEFVSQEEVAKRIDMLFH